MDSSNELGERMANMSLEGYNSDGFRYFKSIPEELKDEELCWRAIIMNGGYHCCGEEEDD